MRDNYLPYYQSETMMDDSSWKFPCFKLPFIFGRGINYFLLENEYNSYCTRIEKWRAIKLIHAYVASFFLKNRSLGFIMLQLPRDAIIQILFLSKITRFLENNFTCVTTGINKRGKMNVNFFHARAPWGTLTHAIRRVPISFKFK